MKNICSLLIVLAVAILALSACSPATQAPPAPIIPVYTPPATATPVPTATPTPTAVPTLSAGDAAIEAAWVIQKPKIDAKISSVFNSSVTNPWLSPIFDPAGLVIPDSPVAHCLAMNMWWGYIPMQSTIPAQSPLSGCQSGHDPMKDFFGITTATLESIGKDNFVMKVYPFMPIPYCNGITDCNLLPMGGGAYYGMRIGSRYKIVTFCGKPLIPAQKGSLIQLYPYLKDPVSMILLSSDGYGYLEIIANRDSYFSFGWTESGKGWSETYKFCPTNGQ